MRVLFLTQWFQPEPMLKGISFAKALVDRGHEVEILTGFPNYPGGELYPGYRVRLWQREMMQGIRVNRTALYPSHDQSGWRRIVNYLSFALTTFVLGPWLVQKPHVIYVYNLVTLGPTAILMRMLFGAKILLDVQDLWPESVTNSGMLRNSTAQKLLKAICVWVYRQADWIVVLSPGFKEALVQRGVSPDRIEVIYNWCDEEAQKPAPRDETLAREVGMAGRFNVLFAGTMGVMQGLDTVLDAAALLQTSVPEVQVVLVGGGVERERLEKKATVMGLDNVRLLPRQQPEAMGQYYALADALLVHLKDDPLFLITIPSKTQVYMSMGKPIIMAMQGDAADLVEQAGAGLICEPDQPEILAKTIETLATMPSSDRQRLAQQGQRFYTQHLSFQSGVDRFESRMAVLTERDAHGVQV